MKKLLSSIKVRRLTLGVVIATLLAIGGLAVYNLRTHTPTAETITYSTDTPSETRPDSKYKWEGASNDPKKIKISSIGVDAYIQNVGVDQNNQVAVPTNLYLVGWFVDTVRPGEKGLSLIDGHVSGRRNDGVFKDLDKLKVGDEYAVEFGDGTTEKFKVIGKESAPVSKAVSVMFSQRPGVSNQLNLVTCSGAFDAKTSTYSERLTVFSEKIET